MPEHCGYLCAYELKCYSVSLLLGRSQEALRQSVAACGRSVRGAYESFQYRGQRPVHRLVSKHPLVEADRRHQRLIEITRTIKQPQTLLARETHHTHTLQPRTIDPTQTTDHPTNTSPRPPRQRETRQTLRAPPRGQPIKECVRRRVTSPPGTPEQTRDRGG